MQARVIFGILSFALFLVTHVSRVNINIAVIIMEDSKFGNGWDGKVLTLSALFWFSWITELTGSSLARRFGFRNVLGMCMLIGGGTNFIFPVCYRFHPVSAAVVKAIQGVALGPVWPVISLMSASWIPKNERSKFASTFHGTGVGSFVAYVLGGILIEYLGWPSIFYASGILSMLWLICWWIFAADTPEKHPTISDSEKKYLRDEIGDHTLQTANYQIPWKPMLQSKAFWGNILGQVATMWMIVSYGIQLPAFVNAVYDVSVKTNGLIVGLPNISCFLFSLVFSIFIDRMIKTGVLSITTARKVATTVSHLLSAVLTLLLAFYGLDNIYIGVALVTLTVTIYGAATTGTTANIVDISPNNSGLITSIGRMFSILPGFIIPVMIKHFTATDAHNWIPVLSITVGIIVTSGLSFLCLASGEVQHWDKQKEVTEENVDLMDHKKGYTHNSETNNL